MTDGARSASYNLLAPLRAKSRVLRVIEVLFLSLLTSCVLFVLADSFSTCSNNGSWTCRDSDNFGARCAGPADNTTGRGLRAQCVNATGWTCAGGGNNGLFCHGRGGFEDCEWRGGSCLALHQSDSVFGMRGRCAQGQYAQVCWRMLRADVC